MPCTPQQHEDWDKWELQAGALLLPSEGALGCRLITFPDKNLAQELSKVPASEHGECRQIHS